MGGCRYLVTRTASGKTEGKAALLRAEDRKHVVVPASVRLPDGRLYKITIIGKGAFQAKKIRKITIGKNVKKLEAKAFAKSKASVLVLKTGRLTKSRIRGCLKGSAIRKIAVRVSSGSKNKKYKKKYKKIFTRKLTGKKVIIR